MKILVTGANGYLGQGIVSRLLDAGDEVIAADFSTIEVDARAMCVDCNIFEVDNPWEFFGSPDVVLHLAWRDGFKHYSDAHIQDLPKHYDFLKTLLDAGLKHLAILGSMHEVGYHEGMIGESTPCEPVTPYGIAKNALKDLMLELTPKYEAVLQWLRGYYIVGDTERGSSIFSKIVQAAKQGQKHFPFTTGVNEFDFIDYKDFCENVSAVVQQTAVNGVIEICSGKPEKLCDRVERFIRDNKFDITLDYGTFPERPYDSKSLWGDVSKLNKVLSKIN